MFRTDLLSIIRSLDTVFTTGICHTSYVACLLARSEWSSIPTSLADSFIIKIYHDAQSSKCQIRELMLSPILYPCFYFSDFVPFS